MTARFATWAWLLVVFLATFESATPAGVLGGGLLAAVLMALFRPRRVATGPVRVRPLRLLVLAGYFAAKLVQANLHVAWAVVAPRRAGVRRAIVAVPLVPSSDAVVWLLAMAVSLTPGTSVVDSRDGPPVLYVHLLQLTSVEAARTDVLRMQRLLVRALGPERALPEIERRLDELARREATEGSAT